MSLRPTTISYFTRIEKLKVNLQPNKVVPDPIPSLRGGHTEGAMDSRLLFTCPSPGAVIFHSPLLAQYKSINSSPLGTHQLSTPTALHYSPTLDDVALAMEDTRGGRVQKATHNKPDKHAAGRHMRTRRKKGNRSSADEEPRLYPRARGPDGRFISTKRKNHDSSDSEERPSARGGGDASMTCCICDQEFPDDWFPDTPLSDDCRHANNACLYCISKHINRVVSDQVRLSIGCPTCLTAMDLETVRKYAREDDFSK